MIAVCVTPPLRLSLFFGFLLVGYLVSTPMALAQDANLPDAPPPPPASPAVISDESRPSSTPSHSPDLQGETIHDAAAVANCLCDRQEVSEFSRRLARAKQAYDEDQAQLQQVQAALDTARTHIDVNDIDAVNAFRRLSMHHQEIASRLNGQTQPADTEAAKQYNDAVASYNLKCAGRRLEPATVAQVQPSLICRAPELP